MMQSLKWLEKNYVYVNNDGIEFSIRPSMSWQIWWSIPLNKIDSKTRLLIAN